MAVSPQDPLTAPVAGAAAPPAAREPRAYVPTLALANFGVYIALLTPVMLTMALKVQHLVGTERQASVLGTVLGIGALFALVCNPLAGRLSDRTTSRLGMRKPWVLGGAVGGFLALALVGSATSVWMLVVGWCLAQALLNGALAAVNATLPDQVPEHRRGLASGLVGIGIPLAILTGSLIANAFSSDVTRFVAPAALALLLCALFALLLHDRTRESRPAQPFGFREFVGSFVFDPRKHPDFGWAWLTKFLVMFGYAGIATYLLYFLQAQFGLDEAAAVGVVVAANIASTVAMIASSFVGGWLSDRVGRRKPFVTAAGVIMVVGLVLLAFAPSTAVVVVAQGIIGLGAGSFMSVDLALATQVLPDPEDTAKDLGVLNMANALPQSLAPMIAPAVIALGDGTAVGGYPAWYAFGALVSLVGALLVHRIKGVR
ncbi:MFS transporter [Kineococcus glutinatus]|uniref:MFS transporter n=1 Tax=Kineococcus glutinatus TaxID=1070872 RepID=A0ABP9HM52_9ACTN